MDVDASPKSSKKSKKTVKKENGGSSPSVEGPASKTKSELNSEVESLEEQRLKIKKDLQSIERQIYFLEEHYLEETSSVGNVVKGWDQFLGASLPKSNQNLSSASSSKRSRIIAQDRVFSMSSTTAPQE